MSESIGDDDFAALVISARSPRSTLRRAASFALIAVLRSSRILRRRGGAGGVDDEAAPADA